MESTSKGFPQRSENNTGLKSPETDLVALEKLFQEKNARDIHAKAMDFLQNNQEGFALLLLKKNLYHNFFLPSFLILYELKVPAFLRPFYGL